MVYAISKKAIETTVNTGSYLNETECWGYYLYDLAAISAYYMGLYHDSYRFAKLALEKSPDNPRLKSNLELIEKKLGKEEIHEEKA